MRLLRRNVTSFEYFHYTGLQTDLNEDGLHTGEFHPKYDDPVVYNGNISTPSGHAIQAFDGLDVRYTHVLVMDKPDVNIRETGAIRWKEEMYDVTAVRPSLNSVSIALYKRTVNHGDQYEGDPEPDPEPEPTPEPEPEPEPEDP